MRRRILQFVILLCAGVILASALPASSFAHGEADPSGATCTTDPSYNVPANITIITTIVDSISCILYGQSASGCSASNSVSESLFIGITDQGSFQFVVKAVASLFVAIFGIAFMVGIVQLTLSEFLVRAVKLSIVLFLITEGAWNFFYQTVGVFFQNGTNWLIGLSTQIALGSVNGVDASDPLAMIDYAIATAFSAKMFVTIMAMYFTSQHGWLYAALMIMGLGSFVGALFQAIWIYLMSMIVRAFLFGLAPIFLIFILFTRTRNLFDGWLNQLVNSMLQPVLLFTFFAFFAVLVQGGMENILQEKVCFTKGVGIYDGAPSDLLIPKLTVNGDASKTEYNWTGPKDCTDGNCKTFAIDIIDVLIFVLLTQLAWRFNGIAINMAKEIAGVSTDLNIHGAFSQIMSPRHAATRQFIGNAKAAAAGAAKGGGAAVGAAKGGGAAGGGAVGAPPVGGRGKIT